MVLRAATDKCITQTYSLVTFEYTQSGVVPKGYDLQIQNLEAQTDREFVAADFS